MCRICTSPQTDKGLEFSLMNFWEVNKGPKCVVQAQSTKYKLVLKEINMRETILSRLVIYCPITKLPQQGPLLFTLNRSESSSVSSTLRESPWVRWSQQCSLWLIGLHNIDLTVHWWAVLIHARKHTHTHTVTAEAWTAPAQTPRGFELEGHLLNQPAHGSARAPSLGNSGFRDELK